MMDLSLFGHPTYAMAIVTILADSGSRYQSKLFNPQFLRGKGLPVPQWLERRTNVKVPYQRA